MSSGGLVQAFERFDGTERIAVYWKTDGIRHWCELARERKTLDGWTLTYRITFAPSDLWMLHDAIGAVCDLAGGVRR